MLKNQPESNNIAILGAGNGGLALAGYLSSKGHSISLYNRTFSNIKKLQQNPVITLQNQFNSSSRLKKVTSNLVDAIDGCKIIFVTTTADAHEDLIKKMEPYRKEEQVVILNPGGVGSVIACQEHSTYPISETNILLYACRKINENNINIKGIKKNIFISGISDSNKKTMKNLFSQFEFSSSPLETSLNYYNVPAHLPAAYMNLDLIMNSKLDLHYVDGVTREVADLIECVDEERKEICDNYSVKFNSVKKVILDGYKTSGNNMYEIFQNCEAYKTTKAPRGLNHRIFFEDIPYGLIPLIDLANIANVKTPNLNKMLSGFNKVKNFYDGARRINEKQLSNFSKI